MSTRYVWEKFEALFEAERIDNDGSESDLYFFSDNVPSGLWQHNFPNSKTIYYSSSYSIINGKFVLDSPSSASEIPLKAESIWLMIGTTEYEYIMYAYAKSGKVWFDSYGYLEIDQYSGYVQVSLYQIAATKGNSLNSYVASINSSAYPSDGNSGANWYVKQGSDCIDPTAVTIPAEIEAGGSLPVTVTKRANTYGGTITYTYQYSIDGGSTWTSAGSTTATTKNITVPDGAETIRVRVVAKDNYGFTSTTYVTSNEAVVLSGTNFTAGVDGVLRELSELDTCVDGVIRPLAHVAVSVDGVLREIF